MQSGISASQELHSAFKTLVDSPNQRGLLCTIQKESLLPLSTLLSASSSFENDLSLLAPYLQPKEALYIILRRYPSTESAPFIAITYVPDSAPVRQKMLFASTRLTLTRELGIERFRETIFATTPAELTAEGFEKHDKHTKLEAPLTEEEQSLGEVKRKEAEEGRGMTERKSHLSGGVSMPMDANAVAALKALVGENAHNFVSLKIDIKTETLVLDNSSAVPINSLGTAISVREPRYSFYRYTHTYSGEECSPILFIYTCPSDSNIKERMMYASYSRSTTTVAETEAGLTIAKRIEASDPSDITEESVLGDLHPKVEMKKAFERPRRPGRK